MRYIQLPIMRAELSNGKSETRDYIIAAVTLVSAFFGLAIVTVPDSAFACSVCFVSKKENLMAFFGTGVLLSLLPFLLIGGLALWLYRQTKNNH